MKWRYAWRELWHHPLMMLLIFVQNVVVFAVTVSMISTIVSRYNTYREISDLVSGNHWRVTRIITRTRRENGITAVHTQEKKLKAA